MEVLAGGSRLGVLHRPGRVCVCQGVIFDGFDGFGSTLLQVAVSWSDSSGQHDSSARAHLERLPESLHRRLQRRLRAKSGNIDRKRS